MQKALSEKKAKSVIKHIYNMDAKVIYAVNQNF